MPVIVCPGCGVRLRFDSQPSGKFACPKCKKVMRLASPAAIGPGEGAAESPPQSASVSSNSSIGIDPLATACEERPPVDGGYMANVAGQNSHAYSSPNFGGSTKRSEGLPADLKVFTKKLAVIVGIIAVAIVASLPLTYISNSFVCLVPILLVTFGCLGLAFWARIWFVVLGFSQSRTQGLMVLFVPYYWLFFLSKNKQICLKPLSVLGAALIPGLLGLVVIAFFKPDFDGTSAGSSLRLTSAQQARAREILLVATSNAQPGELLTVQFPMFASMKPDASSLGERALSQLPGYVAGSFKISPDQKTLTLQYRGSDKGVALHYAMVLPGEAGLMLGFEPRFIDNN